MHKRIMRVLAAAGLALAAPGLAGLTGLTAPGAAGAVRDTAHAAAAGQASLGRGGPGTELWVTRTRSGEARSVAVSPDGTRVHVTGTGYGTYNRTPYRTVAYNAVTGAVLWVRTHEQGSGGQAAEAETMAVSPDGTKVFVTGSNPAFDYLILVTVAYNAFSGARLWTARYSGPHVGGAVAASMRVSTDGKRLFVTGTSYTSGYGGGDTYYATVAYSAATGRQAWASLYNGTVNGRDHASAIALSPGGSRVFVTGISGNGGATVAYRAATGTRLWASRFGGQRVSGIAVNPAGTKVFITGHSRGARSQSDYETMALSASTGARLWASRYDGPASGNDVASAIAVSPGGGRTVFVTGCSFGGSASSRDYATIAYSAQTGARLWVKRYSGPVNGNDAAAALAVSPSAGTVYVTGRSSGGPTRADLATIAYRAATGGRLWVMRYGGDGNDSVSAIAVGPRGGVVFVAGTSSLDNHLYYATVAYGG